MVESQKDSNETKHIIYVRTKIWPHLNVDSDVSGYTKYTIGLPLQPSFESNLVAGN